MVEEVREGFGIYNYNHCMCMCHCAMLGVINRLTMVGMGVFRAYLRLVYCYYVTTLDQLIK